MKKQIAASLIALAVALNGCGSSVLIKQEATSTVTAGINAITEINKFYDFLFNKQAELAATIIARNTSCQYGEFIVVRIPKNQGDKNKGLCLSSSEISAWYKDKSLGKEVKLTPLEKNSLKTSMDILEAFSVYIEALSKHTATPGTPIASTLVGVKTELESINTKVEFLEANTKAKLAQSAAITDFIAYLEKLIENSNNAKEIENIVTINGARQEENLLAVAAEADGIYKTYVATMSSTLTTTLGEYYNKNMASKEFDTAEKRQIYLSTLFKQEQLDNQISTSPSPGGAAIRKFATAHAKLRNAISGNYSEEQKAFLVDENTKELKEGLQNLASLVQFALSVAI